MDGETLKYIIPAATGLIGVVIGLIFTFFTNSYLKAKEVRLRIVEKIFDKRLKAHEDLLSMAKELRTTVSTHSSKDGENIDSYPALLHNIEYFNHFKGNFSVTVNANSHWISIELFRLLNYIQDYLENVSQTVLKISETNFLQFGVIVKTDFIDLAAELEHETLKFFEKDIYNVNLKTTKGHHKWPKEYTIERINSTALMKNSETISAIK